MNCADCLSCAGRGSEVNLGFEDGLFRQLGVVGRHLGVGVAENLRHALEGDARIEHQRRCRVARNVRGETFLDATQLGNLLEVAFVFLVAHDGQAVVAAPQNLHSHVVERDDVLDASFDAALFNIMYAILLADVVAADGGEVGVGNSSVGREDEAVAGTVEAVELEIIETDALKLLAGEGLYLDLLLANAYVAAGIFVDKILVEGVGEDRFCLGDVSAQGVCV